MMKVLNIIVGFAICTLMELATLLYKLVPARKAYDIGAFIGRHLAPFFPERVRLAQDNILKAGITSDPAEAKRIGKASWGHFVGHICESLKSPYVINEQNWREHIVFEGADPEAVKLLFEATDTPILLVSSHHGAWEVATQTIPYVRPMIAIARKMNNPYVARWMKNHHFRGRISIIDKRVGFTGDIIKEWKRDNSAMTILMDQHAGKKHGVKVNFFGRPAWTYFSPAKLAMRFGYPIVVGSFVREAAFKYRLVSGGPPLRFDRASDLAANTQKLNDYLEVPIRQYPEQYLWVHRRWRE